MKNKKRGSIFYAVCLTTLMCSSIISAQNLAVIKADSVLKVLDEKYKIKHTPQPCFVEGVDENNISLNGYWYFNPKPEVQFEQNTNIEKSDGWVPMYVPSEWYMNSYSVDKGEWGGYFRNINIPNDWKGKKVIIRFGAVNSECKLYVNGSYVGYHIGTMNQFEFDITPYLKEEKNNLALYVRSESIADEVGHISYYAHHQVGGILRRVTLMALPATYVSDFYCDATLSTDLEHGSLGVSFDIESPKASDRKNMEVEIVLKKRGIEGLKYENEVVGRKKVKLNSKRKDYQVHIPVVKPDLWHAESPYLYVTELNLYKNNKKIESVNKNIGFRRIEIKGNILLVNNKPVKLRGTAFHDIDPYNGRAIRDTSEIRRDVELYRNANCNYLRTSHYPKDEYFLDLCDRYGIFVENEAPACWLWVPWVKPLTEPEKELEQVFYSFKSLVLRDRSHPSMLIWSLANESKWSNEFLLCYKLAKQLTPEIPVKFSHSEYFGIDNPLDVGSRHYPGWEGIVKYDNHFRPIVFDEAVHVNTYNTSEIITDPGLRDIWGDYLKYFIDNMRKAPAVAGFAIWSGNDEMFYPLNKEPVGYGPLGIIDGFRRAKPEYWHMKMAYSPIQVISETFQEVEGKTIIWLENNYDVNDLSNVEFIWSDGDNTGSLSIKEKAEKQYTLVIPHKMRGDNLKLTINDKRGFTISEWSIGRKKILNTMPEMDYSKKIVCTSDEDKLTVKTQNMVYKFSLSKGDLYSVMKDGTEMIKEGVQMYLIPHSESNEVIDFIPLDSKKRAVNFLSEPLKEWSCDSVSTSLSETKAEVTFWGKYDSIPAKFLYKINGDGHLRIDYIVNVRNLPIQNIRQIGIGFNLPKDFDNLSWNRKTLWSVYPDDHIGRPVGEAKAFYPETLINVYKERIVPKHPFSKDGNIYGSNDFRSTKHNIYKATLGNRVHKIEIESNGKQHIRSWVMPHCVSFMLANYSNGGNESYLSYNSNRTKISPSEFKIDGGDFAGWLQLNFLSLSN